MKIRIADRILVAVAGLVLIALCAAIAGQVFFGYDVAGKAADILKNMNQTMKLIAVAACVVLLIIGVYCVCMMFRHRKGRRGFVTQETENGDLSISLKALETMVLKCVDHHEEMTLQNCSLETEKDGVIIHLKVTMAGGLNIPLATGNLQRLVTQYVTACSGVEVREVKIVVEQTGEAMPESPYVVPEIAGIQPALLRDKNEEEPEERTHLFPEGNQNVTVELPPEKEIEAEVVTESEAAEEAEEAVVTDEVEYTTEPEESETAETDEAEQETAPVTDSNETAADGQAAEDDDDVTDEEKLREEETTDA